MYPKAREDAGAGGIAPVAVPAGMVELTASVGTAVSWTMGGATDVELMYCAIVDVS